MLTIKMNGQEFELATTLRVAYMVQGQHNHAPYAKIFENIDSMTIEEQIGVLYCAFQAANRDNNTTSKMFLDYMLDNSDVKEVMALMQGVIQGIMGLTDEEVEAAKAAEGTSGATSPEK